MGRFVGFITLLLLLFVEVVFTQSLNLQDGKISPAPLPTLENSGEGIASFKVQETSGSDVITPVFGGLPNVTISVDLGSHITLKNGDVSLVSGTSNGIDIVSLFDISFSSITNVLTFNQKENIPADILEEIRFPIEVTKNSSRSEKYNGFVANIVARGITTNATGDTSFFTYTSGSKLNAIKSVVNVPSNYSVGTVINYEIVVVNSGNELISNIEVKDPGATITSGNPISSLAPGNSSTVLASYTLTQADIDQGSYINSALITGDSPFGIDDVITVSDTGTDPLGVIIQNPLTIDGPDTGSDPTDDPTVLDFSRNRVSEMTLIKSVTSKGPYVEGTLVSYELEVTNTGNVTLSDIEVVDDGAIILSGSPINILTPGASAKVLASYTLTKADITTGSYSNSATAIGDSPDGIDDVRIISDSGTDENGDIIINPLTVDGPDEGNDPKDDPTILKLGTCLTVFNEFSPNEDGVNDFFKINCIENYPNNSVEVFNRWGNTVYKVEKYNNQEISFRGISEGRGNINTNEELPTGTYFYVIDLGDGSDLLKGWLYLNR